VATTPACAQIKLADRGPKLNRQRGWHRKYFASEAAVEWALLTEVHCDDLSGRLTRGYLDLLEAHEHKLTKRKTQVGFVSHGLNWTSEQLTKWAS
jgi:hypothetical protein